MGSAALFFAPPGRTEWKRCPDRRSPHRGATEATSLDGQPRGWPMGSPVWQRCFRAAEQAR